MAIKRKSKRPPRKITPRPPGEAVQVADSMKQAAAILNHPVASLKFAKSCGCQAFKGSRVNIPALRDWLAAHHDEIPDPAGIPPEDVLDRKIKARRLADMEFDAQLKDGQYFPAKDVFDSLHNIGTAQRALLQSKLEQELPGKLVGLDAIAMRAKFEEVTNELCKLFADGIEKWTAVAQPNPSP